MTLVQFECHICGEASEDYRLGVDALKHRDCPVGWVGGTHNRSDICPACLALLAPLAVEAVQAITEILGRRASNDEVFPGEILARVIRHMDSDRPNVSCVKVRQHRQMSGSPTARRYAPAKSDETAPEPKKPAAKEEPVEAPELVPETDEAPQSGGPADE